MRMTVKIISNNAKTIGLLRKTAVILTINKRINSCTLTTSTNLINLKKSTPTWVNYLSNKKESQLSGAESEHY